MPQLQINDHEPRPTHLVRELARVLRVHPITVYRQITAGKIEATRIGGVLRIPDREYRRLTGDAGAAGGPA